MSCEQQALPKEGGGASKQHIYIFAVVEEMWSQKNVCIYTKQWCQNPQLQGKGVLLFKWIGYW
jgi:hypothetical protein